MGPLRQRRGRLRIELRRGGPLPQRDQARRVLAAARGGAHRRHRARRPVRGEYHREDRPTRELHQLDNAPARHLQEPRQRLDGLADRRDAVLDARWRVLRRLLSLRCRRARLRCSQIVNLLRCRTRQL